MDTGSGGVVVFYVGYNLHMFALCYISLFKTIGVIATNT